MKTLAVLLLLAVGLGATWWKTQRPDAGIDEMKAEAVAAIGRLGNGLEAGAAAGLGALRDGGEAGREAEEASRVALESTLAENREAFEATRSDLSSRIDSLENELTRTMTSSEAGVVQGRLADTEARLAASDERLEAAFESFEAAAQGNQALLSRLTEIDGRLDLLARRIDESDDDSALDELTERLGRLGDETRLGLDDTRTTIGEMQSELVLLADSAETLEARLATIGAGGGPDGDARDGSGEGAALATVNDAIDQRIANLESKLATSRADTKRLDALGEQIARLGERQTQSDGRDAERDQTLASLGSSLEEVSTKNDALSIDSVQQQISEQLANLEASVDTDTRDADVDELTDTVEAARNSIRELESRVQSLPAASSAADSAQQSQSALESQIAALERRLEQLPQQTDPALVSGLDAVREQVEEIQAKGFVTQEELRAQVEGKSVEYKIYFDKNSTQVTEDAARVLDSFIAQETNRTTGVAIYGFTDTTGDASYNQQLAQRRAANVRSYLIKNGFDYTKIGNVAGLGEDAAAAILEDEQEDANQRVVVLFSGQL